ncbi:unnamed protein product [Echinostoma caproni]|uniref:Disease resistance R13L4/SHOC-2-like LRR domain-containing protein n=1 Tax=Echinostoma caproni TaxID=27848 RepID=A0A3P8GQW2_9TREM|nr:unnamed protein product [Echinostoma caproni]
MGQLPNLSELWMDDNQLKSVPKELGNMKRLQQLDLSENLIDALPEEVAGLTSLSDLNLSQNSLNCLPTGFGELKKLGVLKLNQNQLLTLNPAIGGLPHEKDIEECELTIFLLLSCEVDTRHLLVDHLLELMYHGSSECDECFVGIPYPQTRL